MTDTDSETETEEKFRVTPDDLGEPPATTMFAHTGRAEPEKRSRGTPRGFADLVARVLPGSSGNDETTEES